MAKHGRRLYSNRTKSAILIRQKGRCGYCNISLLGAPIQWDHFIPHAYLQASGGEGNWVASCGECNRRKSARMFRSEGDIAAFCSRAVNRSGEFGDGWPDGSDAWQQKLQIDSLVVENVNVAKSPSEKSLLSPNPMNQKEYEPEQRECIKCFENYLAPKPSSARRYCDKCIKAISQEAGHMSVKGKVLYLSATRKITGEGFVWIQVNGTWVAEQRYELEKKLGRKLVQGESARHKNGVKDDNRHENLELRVALNRDKNLNEDAVA